MTNWMVGSLLAWPVAAMIGRKFKTSRSGVPLPPLNRWLHDFPHPEPGRVSRLRFRYYSLVSAVALGFIFAKSMGDDNIRNSNPWYNRHDLKPKAAMVVEPGSAINTSMMKDQYMHLNKQSEGKSSPIYRYFFARDADFTVKENPYRSNHSEDVWNHNEGLYTGYSNDFRSHHN